MTRPSAHTGAEPLRTWSAAHLPPGTPIRHTIDIEEPEICLVIGEQDRVELAMDPLVAGELVLTLRRAVREYNAAHASAPIGPDVA